MSITEIFPAERRAGTSPVRRINDVGVRRILPTVAPGQLWLVELPTDDAIAVTARHVLDGANVVIYDRALSEIVAELLPLGSYAEPAAEPEKAAARCVHFARDGWSVARLLSARLPQRERTRRVQDMVDVFAGAKVAGRLPVSILSETADGIREQFAVRFDDLAASVAAHPRDTLLTIVIDAFAGAAAATRLHAVAANGLAG